MPGCWPTVVWRSVGRDADGHGPMIRAGTIRRVSTWTPGSAALPAFRAVRRAVAAGAAAALLGRPRWSGRGLDQARGPAAARVRWQQAAQPRVPGRRRAGRGRRLPRHDRPALVEPRPADRGGRGEGRAGRPPRAVRAAGRPAQPGRPARRAARRDGPPGGDRRPRRARGPRRARRGRAARRRAGGRTSSRSAGPGSSGRSARSSPGSSSSTRLARARSRAGRPSSSRRRPAGRRPGCWSGSGRPGLTTDRPWRRRHAAGRRCGRRSRRSSTELGERRRAWPPSTTREIVLDGAPARRRLRPADRGGRRGDPPPGPDRGDPGRSDLHRQGPGRPRRRWSATGALDGRQVVFWHAGGTPGLFEPLDP